MKLQCLACGCEFEQTENIVEQAKTNSHLNFFIKYCKNCRKIKTEDSLKNNPKILNILSESKNEEKMHNFETYNKEQCWQYNIRLENLKDDLQIANLTKEITDNLKISDFTFHKEEKSIVFNEVKEFIEKHEWG